MGHSVAVSFQFPQSIITPTGHLRRERSKFQQRRKKHGFLCFAVIKDQKPPLFSLRFSSFHPLSESPEAPFDEYIEDEARLLRATFPGKSENLNEDEWRVQMPSFQLLFLKVTPVAEVRFSCRSSPQDFPFHIPHQIPKVLKLQLMRWELKGLGQDIQPQSFRISVEGAVYAERRDSKSVLANHLQLNLHTFAPPTPMAFFPQHIFQALAEKGLRGMMEESMRDFTEKLLLDYSKFKEEKKQTITEVPPANCA